MHSGSQDLYSQFNSQVGVMLVVVVALVSAESFKALWVDCHSNMGRWFWFCQQVLCMWCYREIKQQGH